MSNKVIHKKLQKLEANRRASRKWRATHLQYDKERCRAYRAAHREELRAYNRAYKRAWREANPEKNRARHRAYRAAHREYFLAYNRAYRKAHLEEHRARCRVYRKANPEKVRAASRAYRAANPEKVRVSFIVSNALQAAKHYDALGKFTAGQFVELCARYKHRCLCCGKKRKLGADHVIPLSKGGSNFISNIQPLCLPCNMRKGTRSTDYR